ncbi:MAG: ABC transporter permease subunit [Sedimentisphaerales bacterium]|nr:ABC transporter permease subunit [Sedimentisphaerales bacterium]
MRAYELLKETFCRKLYIWMVHLSWLAFYGLVYTLFRPEAEKLGQLLWICSGCLLPLLLSAGVIGDDIASGRIRVLIAKPFWPGELYVYRLIGLSLQGAVHLFLAFVLLTVLQGVTGAGGIENLGSWLVAAWLLFIVWAALSTSLSVVVGRSYNSLLLFVALVFVLLSVDLLRLHTSQYRHAGAKMILDILKYTCPPFVLLNQFATREHGLLQSAAVAAHSLMLMLVYGGIGLFLLHRRQFPSVGR